MNKKIDGMDIVRALKEKGVGNYICPCCGNNSFNVDNSVAAITVTEDPQVLSLGKYIPSAILVCNKCGNLQFFALKALGLMEDKNEKSE